MKRKSLKSKINLYFVIAVILSSMVSITVVKNVIESYAIENTLTQAKQMTNQLLVLRSYLAKASLDVEIDDESKNYFTLTPAYVGGHISKKLNDEYGFYIKQVSLDYRNKENAPDEYETQLLKKYTAKSIEGEYWEINQHDGEDSLRYSVPLYTEQDCMKCHGKPNIDVEEKLYKKLVSRYGDKSFNYKLGDLRGAISVAIPMTYVFEQNETLYTTMYMLEAFLLILFLIYLIIERKLIIDPELDEATYKEEYKETVIDSNYNAIIAIDSSATITTYNKKAEEMFGWSKEEMIGTQNLLFIVPDKYKKSHLEFSKKYLQTKKSTGIIDATHELEGLRKDGTIFPLQISFGTNDKSHNIVVVANIIDITQRKKLEEELLSLNKNLDIRVHKEIEKNRLQEQQMLQQSRLAQMGEMISMIAHQWRQPLSAISTTAVSMKFSLELQEHDLDTKKGQIEQDKYFQNKLTDIENFVRTLTTTIDDFRNFYKPNKQVVDSSLQEICEKSLAIINASLKSDGVEIIYEYNSQEKQELYDTEMMQVLLNIFQNSQDNFKEQKILHPQIKITTIANKISICDNGRGVSEDILNKVFDPYFSTKDKKNGTGLGLYMS
ncbi:MAG: DUF3365 domain-containing protein, partial [Campylobacterota bacterium]|nr:DUF3365 domain-containing protein [Campylobacterota bacterium]